MLGNWESRIVLYYAAFVVVESLSKASRSSSDICDFRTYITIYCINHIARITGEITGFQLTCKLKPCNLTNPSHDYHSQRTHTEINY